MHDGKQQGSKMWCAYLVEWAASDGFPVKVNRPTCSIPMVHWRCMAVLEPFGPVLQHLRYSPDHGKVHVRTQKKDRISNLHTKKGIYSFVH